ncbi:hypothetical protein IT412_03530 [Candidatus Peregrinibacteria bacterium]|nr:hypothetical protein [Candidatus Peregrinibacteria bacterium]
MQIYESEKFQEIFSQSHLAELQSDHPDLPSPIVDQLKIYTQRATTLASIESATGLSFDVVTSGHQSNVAAFVDVQTEKAYITLETLADPALALHAAHHEKGHLDSGIYDFHMDKFLNDQQLKAIKQAIGPNFDQIDWVEAFNEANTFQDHGRHAQSGYAAKEVPAGQKIHQLAMQKLGKSVLGSFASGQKLQLENIIKELADHLILDGHINQHHSQITNLFSSPSSSIKRQIFFQ